MFLILELEEARGSHTHLQTHVPQRTSCAPSSHLDGDEADSRDSDWSREGHEKPKWEPLDNSLPR